MNTVPLQRDGQLRGTIAVVTDMTERLAIEQSLRSEEESRRLIVDTALDAVIGMDDQGQIITWNQQAAVIFGWTAEEALGSLMSDLIIPPQYAEGHKQGMARYFATGEGPILNKRIEIEALHRNGHTFPIELSVAPVTGSSGQIWFSSFARDITNQKQLQSDLARARDEALEASRLKSQFLATMSHEIRTPMNSIIGLSELMLDTSLDDEQSDFMRTLRQEAKHLLEIINGILDLSKIEAGRLELDPIHFDPGMLAVEVLDMLENQADAKQLTMTLDKRDTLPAGVIGDPVRLRQILINLVGNAVKFTQTGGVTLGCGFSVVDDVGLLQFDVEDSGIGIPAAALPSLFDPFTQVDGSSTRVYGGTGLGLAISQRLAQLMQGEITVQSTLGEGSRFTVTVRVKPATPAPERLQTAPLPRHDLLLGEDEVDDRPVILIVEDQPTNQTVARKQLNRLGYRSEIVANGAEAVARFETAGEYFAAILMDCQMPVMNGFTATEAIRALETETARRIPIIAMTAGALEGDKERCLASGMDDYISKPVTRVMLMSTLNRWVKR